MAATVGASGRRAGWVGETPVRGAPKAVAELLAEAGIAINGGRPWDIEVRDGRFFSRLLASGSLGAGESYVDGWWECGALDEMFARIFRRGLDRRFPSMRLAMLSMVSRAVNLQSRWLSRRVADGHYSVGNELYEAMLGPSMQYSCGYWKDAGSLDEAQRAKLDLVGRKLELEPGMSVLELGGGFGMLARHLAEEFGCRVVSYNICGEQVAYGRKACAGLPVRIEQKDYRDAAAETGMFDRVVSVGLCEHVGYRNYRGLARLAWERLKEGGLWLLHTIGGNESMRATDPWIDRYIFPGGMIPSIAQLGAALEPDWVVEDWHNFGPDYDRTLMAWHERFEAAWPRMGARYGERFARMWRYYLLSSAAAFRERRLQLWQFVASKGRRGRYEGRR